jgi:hypothetical protein
MMRQLICAACTIPVVYPFYARDKAVRDNVYGSRSFTPDGKNIAVAIFSIVGGASLGIAANNIIAMTPLMSMSEGFNEANSSFFAGSFFWEMAGSGLIIPIAEELLFRGVVYGRIKLYTYTEKYGAKMAIVLSALIFGILHFNIVQFVYAAAIGLFLAFIYERSQLLMMPVLAHMAANVVAIIRADYGWLSFAYYPTAQGLCVTAALLIAAAASLFMIDKYLKEI